MGLKDELCTLLINTARSFKGSQRRRFMAQTVQELGLSQRCAQQRLGWGRDTLRKAMHEIRSGITCCDAFAARGRKPAEVHLPHLLDDIRALAKDHCQTDPSFRTTRLYCRLTAAAIRAQLIDRKGYTTAQLPSVRTLSGKLNALGFRLRKVAKCRPLKKFPRPTLSLTN